MWPGRPTYLALDLAEPVMALSSTFVVVAVEYEPPAMQPEPRPRFANQYVAPITLGSDDAHR